MSQPSPPPGYGAPYPPGGPFPPPGQLVVHLQGSWFISAITPTVLIDGQPVPARYGENHYPVEPGRHVVAMQAQWVLTYGRAHLEMAVASGRRIDVWYATPWHQFAKQGSIGFEKQRHRGAWLAWVAGAFVIVAVLVLVLAGLFPS